MFLVVAIPLENRFSARIDNHSFLNGKIMSGMFGQGVIMPTFCDSNHVERHVTWYS